MPVVVTTSGKRRRGVRLPISQKPITSIASATTATATAAPTSTTTTTTTSGATSQKTRRRELLQGFQRLVVASKSSSSSHHPPRSVKLGPGAKMATNVSTTTSKPLRQQQYRRHPGVPDLFAQKPPIRDQLVTESSEIQDKTVDQVLPLLRGEPTTKDDYDYDYGYDDDDDDNDDGGSSSDVQQQNAPLNQFGVPRLNRDEHIAYLYDSLEMYPDRFVTLDAARPWMCYWALVALTLLGEDVSKFRERYVLLSYVYNLYIYIYIFTPLHFKCRALNKRAKVYMSQSHCYGCPHAKSYWRFWWRTWSNVTLCVFLRNDS